jgi:hypothetical protein
MATGCNKFMQNIRIMRATDPQFKKLLFVKVIATLRQVHYKDHLIELQSEKTIYRIVEE